MVDSNSSRARRPFPRTGLATLVVALIAGGVVLAGWWSSLPDDVRPQYVGRETCARCHTRQTQLFTDSHHDLALDRATPQTVLGDFNDATLTHHGITSRMFRRGERFFVNTEGPDGTLADFEVKYVLGVDPLQNYMVEFDRPAEMPESDQVEAPVHLGRRVIASDPEPATVAMIGQRRDRWLLDRQRRRREDQQLPAPQSRSIPAEASCACLRAPSPECLFVATRTTHAARREFSSRAVLAATFYAAGVALVWLAVPSAHSRAASAARCRTVRTTLLPRQLRTPARMGLVRSVEL